MNKTCCFLFFILLSVFYSATAGNWELFPFNQSSYYSDDGSTDFNHLYHYTQDSIRDDGASKTFFFNRFPYSLNHDQCIFESCKLLGDSTEFDSLSSNNSFYYFIFGNDSAEIFQFAQQGDFWFIKCPNGSQGFDSIKVTCNFNDITTIIGQADSVKRFLIEAWNNGIATNYFNNYEFELSKTFGLTKWFSFQFLLHQNNLFDARKYFLVGCSNNGINTGYTLPTFEDYFSCYQPGSIFKWKQTHQYDYCIWRDSIISTIWDGDSLKATVFRRQECFENISNQYLDESANSKTLIFFKKNYENIFSKTFSQLAFENNGVSIPFEKNLVLGIFLNTVSISEHAYQFQPPGCFPNNVNPNWGSNFAIGPGIILHGISYPYSHDSPEYMTGYFCDGQGYGDWERYVSTDSTEDSSTVVEIPNCTDYLISNITDEKLNVCLSHVQQFKIFDSSGKLLLSGKSDNSEIDVSKLVPGIYILEIKYANEFYHHKFFKY